MESGQLVRVIHMEHHGVICTGMTERCLQFRCQALRNDHRQAGVYTDSSYVAYFINGFNQLCEGCVLKHQWVATAEYDFRDAGVGTDIVQSRFSFFPTQSVVGIVEMSAKAVAAVNGAAGCCQHQHPPLVFVNNPRAYVRLTLTKGVDTVAW